MYEIKRVAWNSLKRQTFWSHLYYSPFFLPFQQLILLDIPDICRIWLLISSLKVSFVIQFLPWFNCYFVESIILRFSSSYMVYNILTYAHSCCLPFVYLKLDFFSEFLPAYFLWHAWFDQVIPTKGYLISRNLKGK